MYRISAFLAGVFLNLSVAWATEAVTFHSAGPGPDPFGPIGVFTVSGVATHVPLTGEEMLAFVEEQAKQVSENDGKPARSLLLRIYKDASQVGQIDFTENMLLRLADGDNAYSFVGFGVDPSTLSMDIFLLQQGSAFDQSKEDAAVELLKKHLFRETAVAQTVQKFRVMTVLVDGAKDGLQNHVRVIEPGPNGATERVENF